MNLIFVKTQRYTMEWWRAWQAVWLTFERGYEDQCPSLQALCIWEKLRRGGHAWDDQGDPTRPNPFPALLLRQPLHGTHRTQVDGTCPRGRPAENQLVRACLLSKASSHPPWGIPCPLGRSQHLWHPLLRGPMAPGCGSAGRSPGCRGGGPEASLLHMTLHPSRAGLSWSSLGLLWVLEMPIRSPAAGQPEDHFCDEGPGLRAPTLW